MSGFRRTFTLLTLAGLGGAALVVLPRASASAVPDTTPALAATGADSMSLIWRSSAPGRLQQQSATGGRWAGPTAFTAARPLADTSGVGLGADPASGRTLAAAVADEQVWARTEPGGAWSALGGPATGSSATGTPAVAALGRGAFAVVVRDDEGTVHVRHLRAGRWSGWTSLGGTFSTSPAAVGRAGRVVIAAAGRKHQVRTAVVTAGRSSIWRATGVTSTATPGLAAEPGTGTLHLITRNRDLTPSARVSVNGARTWGRPTRLAGRLGSGIAATSRAPGTVDIAALGLDGRPVQNTLRPGGWDDFRLVAPTSTTVLPRKAVVAVTGDPAGLRSIRFAAGAALPRPGEILAATSTPATPEGLLVKVVSVAGDTVRAGPATLTEAIPEGTIDETFALGSAGGPLIQPINREVTCTNGAKATINGTVTINPAFDLDASWHRRGGLSHLAFTGTLTEDAQLQAAISGGGPCALKETPLLTEPVRFQPVVFSVGPVPVVITPELRLHLDATGSVQATLATAAGRTATITAGLDYRDGTVSPLSALGTTGTGAGAAWVSPEFSFLVYGVAGPQLRTHANVRGDGRPQGTVRAELSAGLRLAVPQLGVDQGGDDIIHLEKPLPSSS